MWNVHWTGFIWHRWNSIPQKNGLRRKNRRQHHDFLLLAFKNVKNSFFKMFKPSNLWFFCAREFFYLSSLAFFYSVHFITCLYHSDYYYGLTVVSSFLLMWFLLSISKLLVFRTIPIMKRVFFILKSSVFDNLQIKSKQIHKWKVTKA